MSHIRWSMVGTGDKRLLCNQEGLKALLGGMPIKVYGPDTLQLTLDMKEKLALSISAAAEFSKMAQLLRLRHILHANGACTQTTRSCISTRWVRGQVWEGAVEDKAFYRYM